MTTSAREHGTRDDTSVVVAVTVAALVLLYARAPFAVERLWAEDGRDFLGDALRLGPLRSLGQDRQAGYYMIVSRAGGVVASLVPLSAAALAVWLWVSAVTAWLVATVTVSSRTWLRTWPARIVLGLAIVLLPALRVESIANAANLQVTMVFASLIVLISEPRSRVERVNAGVLLVATAFTTIIATALLPFAVYRLTRTRRFQWDALAVSWTVGVALQWLAIAVGRPDPVTRTGGSLSSIASRLWTAGLRDNLQPFDLPVGLAPFVVLAFGALVLTAAGIEWRKGQRTRGVWLVAVPAFGVGLFVLMGSVSGAESRYMVTPALCLVWTTLAAAETLAARAAASGRVSSTVIMTVVGVLLVVAWLPRWTPSEERRSGPTWDDALAAARIECRSRPPDTQVRIQISPVRADAPGQWSVAVPCRDL